MSATSDGQCGQWQYRVSSRVGTACESRFLFRVGSSPSRLLVYVVDVHIITNHRGFLKPFVLLFFCHGLINGLNVFFTTRRGIIITTTTTHTPFSERQELRVNKAHKPFFHLALGEALFRRGCSVSRVSAAENGAVGNTRGMWTSLSLSVFPSPPPPPPLTRRLCAVAWREICSTCTKAWALLPLWAAGGRQPLR